MVEYITKEQAVDALKETLWDDDFDEFLMHYFELSIKKVKPADVAPVVHATTTAVGWDEIYCQWKTCNRCQGDNMSTAIYCNWCGARMDGGESDD